MPIRIAVLILAAIGLLVLNHYAPLQPLSLAAYGGLALAFAGLVSLVRPIRFLAVRTRARAVLVLLAGVAITIAVLAWPAGTIRASGPHQRLDDFMPAYEFGERHEAVVTSTPERLRTAVESVSFADMPAATVLMRLRGMASGRFDAPPPDREPILHLFSRAGTGFLPLDLTPPNEVVFGMVGRPWSDAPPPAVGSPEEFLAFGDPGHVKVAFNIRWTDAGEGRMRITTETRCAGTDDAARRTFARYWRVIYPGSAIIRRVWLDAIVRRAEG